MAYSPKLREEAIRLHKEEGRSAEWIADKFSREKPPGDRPAERTIRNWLRKGTAIVKPSIFEDIVSSALKRHHDEIQEFAEEWQAALNRFSEALVSYDEISLPSNDMPSEINVVEDNPLFSSIIEHFTSKELWSQYSNLKHTFQEAIKAHKKVLNALVSIGESWPDVELGDGFAGPFYEIASSLFSWPGYRHAFTPEEQREFFTIEWKAEGDSLIGNLIGRSYGGSVLKAPNPLSYVERYESMCEQVLQSQEGLLLISLSSKAWNLEKVVYNLISEILLSRSYTTRTCKLCRELLKS